MINPHKQFDYELRGILFYHGKLVRGVLFGLKSWELRLLRLIWTQTKKNKPEKFLKRFYKNHYFH